MMRSYIIYISVCVAFGAATVLATNEPNNKVLVDLLLDQQLASLNAILKNEQITTVSIGDLVLPGIKVAAKGVKVSDLSTMVPSAHSYMWTLPNNTIEAQVFVGLQNMVITMESLTFLNQSFPATVNVKVNSLGFNQKITMQESQCQETYSDFAFYSLDNVTIYTSNTAYNGQDISEFVKEEVQPYVNGLMQQPSFLNVVTKYINFCNGSTLKNIINHLKKT